MNEAVIDTFCFHFFPNGPKAESVVCRYKSGVQVNSLIQIVFINDVKADKNEIHRVDYLQALRYNRGALACEPTAKRQGYRATAVHRDALFVVIKQSQHPALEFKDRTPRSEPFIAVHPPNSEIN